MRMNHTGGDSRRTRRDLCSDGPSDATPQATQVMVSAMVTAVDVQRLARLGAAMLGETLLAGLDLAQRHAGVGVILISELAVVIACSQAAPVSLSIQPHLSVNP